MGQGGEEQDDVPSARHIGGPHSEEGRRACIIRIKETRLPPL